MAQHSQRLTSEGFFFKAANGEWSQGATSTNNRGVLSKTSRAAANSTGQGLLSKWAVNEVAIKHSWLDFFQSHKFSFIYTCEPPEAST